MQESINFRYVFQNLTHWGWKDVDFDMKIILSKMDWDDFDAVMQDSTMALAKKLLQDWMESEETVQNMISKGSGSSKEQDVCRLRPIFC